MQLYDLSQTIAPDMPRFHPSAPAPRIGTWISHQEARQSGRYEGCSCEITEVQMLTSLGTYMDSPYHFHPAKGSIESLRLEQVVLPGRVVECLGLGAGQGIGPEVLEGLDVAGMAVLFRTDWSRRWGSEAYLEHPFVTEACAEALVAGGAHLAGVDFLVIDDARDPRRPVHVGLLAEDILIVENLCGLEQLPVEGFVFHAAPVKVAGAAAFPVRAYGVVA